MKTFLDKNRNEVYAMKKFRLAALLLALVLSCSVIPLTAGMLTVHAGDMTVMVEESFDDYDKGVDGASTSLGKYFDVEANSIGDGYVRIKEDDTGNLILESHVFTQCYLKNPLVNPYVFSLTAYEMQGGHQSGVFFRGPKNVSAYYEGDDGDPNRGASCGFTGIWVYAYSDVIDVNIKSHDTSKPHSVLDNTTSFAMPDGSSCGGGSHCDIRIEDNFQNAALYVDDNLICTFEFSEEVVKRGYSDVGVSVACSKSVTLKDGSGEVLTTIENPLVSSAQSICGWATRSANMSVDNVRIEVEQAETEKPTEKPTEPATEPATEPETSPVESETPADEENTSAASDSSVPETKNEMHAETVGETDDATEVRIVDDSLAVWILIAVMLVAVGVTAGILFVRNKA